MAEWIREMSVGEWYQPAEGEAFEIVGLDTKAEVVLVQHFDGTLEEVDFESWEELQARPCAPPEDVSGALDLDKSDYRDIGIGADTRGDGWQDPLDFLDSR